MESLLFRGRYLPTLLPDNTDFNLSTWESNVGTPNGALIHGVLLLEENRNVILHVGPTNSGKTYHALKHLESSSSGIYCGSMRLLAWEVAQRMNRAGVPCDLITGQEKEEVDGAKAKHKAVTVEMADMTSDYDFAVHEIQMMGCKTRGFSFTRALLGISADELHLCGDAAAAVPLLQEILKVTDDISNFAFHLYISFFLQA